MSIDWSKVITATDKSITQSQVSYLAWKTERGATVEAITVEVDGMLFDGDEVSQGRMVRTVTSAESLDDIVDWTLANNATVQVTARQLKTACRLAGEEQTRIWNDGRPYSK